MGSVIQQKAGVRLEQLHSDGQAERYRLRTLRPVMPRELGNREAAEEAFELEVMASLADPVVQDLMRRGEA